MQIYSIQDLIPEKNIVVFSPHFDDTLFMIGGYINEMKNAGFLNSKHFHINILFSRSSYQARAGVANFDTSLERIKLVVGNRLIEDQECLNEMLGRFSYDYQIMGEDAALLRGKGMANSDMEFPQGSYEDFSAADTVKMRLFYVEKEWLIVIWNFHMALTKIFRQPTRKFLSE